MLSSSYAMKKYRIDDMNKSKCDSHALTMILKRKKEYAIITISTISGVKSTFFMIGDKVKVGRKYLYHRGMKYELIKTGC